MTHEVFELAKLDALTSENTQLKSMVTFYSHNLKAQKLIIDEYVTQNINFRASNIGFTDQVTFLNTQVTSLTERVKALETEKAELVKKLEAYFETKEDEKLKLVNAE